MENINRLPGLCGNFAQAQAVDTRPSLFLRGWPGVEAKEHPVQQLLLIKELDHCSMPRLWYMQTLHGAVTQQVWSALLEVESILTTLQGQWTVFTNQYYLTSGWAKAQCKYMYMYVVTANGSVARSTDKSIFHRLFHAFPGLQRDIIRTSNSTDFLPLTVLRSAYACAKLLCTSQRDHRVSSSTQIIAIIAVTRLDQSMSNNESSSSTGSASPSTFGDSYTD